jgi:predicted nucleic acid-binding protein
MIDAVLDTTVVLHLFRKYQPAINWFNNQQRYGVPSVTWLEVMEGASNKANQAQCKNLLSQFDTLYLTSADQQWAIEQLERFQFSHHIGMNDCLIAAVAYRLQLPLYTHNLSDMVPMLGDLAVKPYA